MKIKRVFLINNDDFDNLISFAEKTKELIEDGYTTSAKEALDSFIKIIERTKEDKNID